MGKTEPKIVANGYSEQDIVDWMRRKLAVIDQLNEMEKYRNETSISLCEMDKKINSLIADATLDIERLS